MLYDDIGGDQRLYDIFAILILVGAAFAAFNLAGRIVEAQRREIGIGMALGLPRRSLAIRPLLVGVGDRAARRDLRCRDRTRRRRRHGRRSCVPSSRSPCGGVPFQLGMFARGAAIGFALPVLAAAIPVWRAVRVAPIEAIRTGLLRPSAAGSRRSLARLPLPRRTTAQMPLRNVLRAPRRTLMTMLGIAAAIVVLIGVIGMVDSFLATIDRGEHELTKSESRSPARDARLVLSGHGAASDRHRALAAGPERRADPAAPGDRGPCGHPTSTRSSISWT